MEYRIVAALLCACAGPTFAAPTVIDFSDQTPGNPFVTPLPNPLVYPSVTFSSANGLRLFTFSGSGLDRGLCPHATNACRSAVTLSFANPVDNLSFDVFQVDNNNPFLNISALTLSGPVSRSIALTRGFNANAVTLSGLSGITQLTLDGTNDEEGVIFDNFRFEVGVAAPGAVPEPATWAMMIVGFGLIGYAIRAQPRVQLKFNFA